ncbi:hypothetical protein Ciccas_006137, partial [Cichlidogyrus casuarinus]
FAGTASADSVKRAMGVMKALELDKDDGAHHTDKAEYRRKMKQSSSFWNTHDEL